MYLVTYQPDTGVLTSAGIIDPDYALPPQLLPPGAAYVDSLPEGDLTAWLYQDGAFVPCPDDPRR